MNNSTKFEDRASSSPSTHEGEPSESLCDRLSRTRDTSQRQLPTDQDYAVSTREYQTDQSSLKHDSTAACPVLEKQQKQPQRQKTQTHRFAGMDRVTPYQRFGINREWIIAAVLTTWRIPPIRGGTPLPQSSRSRIRGLTDSARCAGIHVASNPSAAIARTTPARTRGSRGVA
jgi:hypothetical protein